MVEHLHLSVYRTAYISVNTYDSRAHSIIIECQSQSQSQSQGAITCAQRKCLTILNV